MAIKHALHNHGDTWLTEITNNNKAVNIITTKIKTNQLLPKHTNVCNSRRITMQQSLVDTDTRALYPL